MERCAGPQIEICPPSTRLIRACPDFTRTSLPLRKIVFATPAKTSTLIGPVTAMSSPSINPTASPTFWSGAAAARNIAAQTIAHTPPKMRARRIDFRKWSEIGTLSDSPGKPPGKLSPILYVTPPSWRRIRNHASHRRHQPHTARSRGSFVTKRGARIHQPALRHATPRSPMVAAHPDSDHRGSRLQCDSPSWPDVALRSARLAKRRAGSCLRQTLHLGVLAPRHHSDCLVAPQSRSRGDEHYSFRRTVDSQSDRMAWLRNGAGKFFSRRPSWTGGDGAP